MNQDADKYTKAHRWRKRWYRVVTGLACVVVFCTVYALILPAITLEMGGCEIPEHTHTEECYTQVTAVEKTVPACAFTLHEHTRDCYDDDGNLVCGYADYAVHQHNGSCYDENGTLWCPLPEIKAHTHSENCYAVPEVHEHTEDCYTLEQRDLICQEHVHTDACYTESRELICPLEESDGHQHDETCVDENGENICGIEASQGHHHDDSCYETRRELTCGEDSDHQHTDECYEWEQVLICDLPTEQPEPAEPVLICEKPEVILHTHQPYESPEDPGCYDEDGNLVCGQIQVLEHQHSEDCFKTVEEPLDTEALTCTNTDETHTHGPLCYGTWELTCELQEHTHSEECTPPEPVYFCGLEEHTHGETCYDEAGELICTLEEHIHEEACLTEPTEEETQDEVPLILPAGARIPEGYDAQYSCMDSDNRFGVVVYAPEGVLPEGAALSAELLSPDSAAYANAEQALADTKYDGFAAMDIRFLLDGEEVEPEGGVYVCINVMGLLSEDADETSLAVQHHRQSGIALLALDEEEAPTGITLETVADAAQETGLVEAVDSGTGNTLDIAAAFEVESFSTFTVTWQDSYKLILHYVDADRKSILAGESETALATYSELESVTLSQYANRISHSGYAYESAYVLIDDKETTVVQVRYNKDDNKWQYTVDGSNWSDWMDGTIHTADVYLSYTAVEEKTIVPPENNVYPVDAINVWDENANVILVYPRHFSDKDILENQIVINLYHCFPSAFSTPDISKSEWTVYRIENREGRYQVLQSGTAVGSTGVQVDDAYLLLVKKAYIEKFDLYSPKAEWPTDTDRISGWGGDTVQINLVLQHTNTEETTSPGTPLAYLTFSPKENNANAAARTDDVAAVVNSAINFQLFNYSTKINRPNGSGDGDQWRAITPYFQFRGQQESNSGLNDGDRDNRYDEDGFTINHATVERVLVNNYPVLDPNRNALGLAKSPTVSEEDLSSTERSLAYLFGGISDSAVTAYNPANTILQKSGTHYYYNSAYNAVDYDANSNVFRVRNYVERNSSTASYGSAQKYYDFLPFNYTGGQVVGTSGDDAHTYNLESSAVDYWFGMRMDVDFYQSKDGILNGDEMVFHFSGDDDVWVFIDDVLVLDLGGTHGTVTGYINFATGEIQQYLDWDGKVGTVGNTSFPTTIRACYDAAKKEPNGGWNGDIFADYTKHKLSFFYMERGCAVANCAIDFNLPTLPQESLQVAKVLTANNDADADVVKHLEDTMEYKFRVVKADETGNPTNDLLINAGDPYTLSGTGISGSQTCTVGADGYFTLKSGQIAEFSDMLARFDETDNVKRYVVQEVMPTDLTGQYQEVVYSVGSDTGTCTNDTTTVVTNFTGYNSPVQDADVGNLVKYTNKVDTTKLSTLAITKVKEGSSLSGEAEWYYMKVQLGPDSGSLMPISVGTTYYVGNETRNVETAGIIQLKAGETAKVKLLAGTYYSVVEVADEDGIALTGNEGYTPTYSDNARGTITAVDSTVEITVTNTFPNGALELTKNVNNTAGGSTDGEFTFELKFPVEEGWENTAYTATYTTTDNGQPHTSGTLSFTKQGDYAVAAVNLYHNETVTITGLPAGAKVSITETNADGYSIGWNVNQEEVFTKTVEITIGNSSTDTTPVTVICTNTTGYELPNTGGAGTNLYTLGGLLLMAGAAFLLLYIHAKRRKGDVTSS